MAAMLQDPKSEQSGATGLLMNGSYQGLVIDHGVTFKGTFRSPSLGGQTGCITTCFFFSVCWTFKSGRLEDFFRSCLSLAGVRTIYSYPVVFGAIKPHVLIVKASRAFMMVSGCLLTC